MTPPPSTPRSTFAPNSLARRLTDAVLALSNPEPDEELVRQHALLLSGGKVRLGLTALTYAIGAAYVPLWVILLLASVDFAFETKGLAWMKGLQPRKAPCRYVGTLAAVTLSQSSFSLMLALAYQSPLPLAQPFAAGVVSLTMLQMASIRVVHLPYATMGLSATFLLAVGAVLWNWPQRSGAGGLVVSLVSLVAAGYFIFSVVRANHALHEGIARERLAARAADQAKSRFLAQMSHELRTPLNAILGLGHVEMARAEARETRDSLQLVTDAARGLSVMLDDILDMSAIEAGQMPIRPQPCVPRDEILAAAALFRPQAMAQGLSFDLSLSDALAQPAVLDSQRLRQCLSNLWSNALKHTAQGGVSLQATRPRPGLLEIRLSDTGTGIAPADAERLFEPFQRGPGAQVGSGLGLSISRALARAMGGDLRHEPTEVGARFCLTVAAPKAEGPLPGRRAPLPLQPKGGPEPGLSAPGHRPLVLVVDDIATNRVVAKAHLRILGADVVEAASGEEALELLRVNPPDMVFLDMNMPGIDGAETLRRIRLLPSRAARLPVIAMTADASEDHRRRYLAIGMDGYLPKPLTPEAVEAVLAGLQDQNSDS